MNEKHGRGAPIESYLGECATVYEAPNGYTRFGAELLARTIDNTPLNERTIRGLPGGA